MLNMMLFFVNERRDIANLKSWEENDADPVVEGIVRPTRGRRVSVKKVGGEHDGPGRAHLGRRRLQQAGSCVQELAATYRATENQQQTEEGNFKSGRSHFIHKHAIYEKKRLTKTQTDVFSRSRWNKGK